MYYWNPQTPSGLFLGVLNLTSAGSILLWLELVGTHPNPGLTLSLLSSFTFRSSHFCTVTPGLCCEGTENGLPWLALPNLLCCIKLNRVSQSRWSQQYSVELDSLNP